MAEITQPKLKHASNEEREKFALKVIAFINPKFEDEDPNNQISEISIQKSIILDFASKCTISANEFIFALSMASRRQLFIDGEPVKLFREIDILKFGEIETAYLEFKRADPKYNQDKEKIKTFLNPPKMDLTEEEKKIERTKFFKTEFKNLHEKGSVLGSVFFYPIITHGLKHINLAFVERFLLTFNPKEYRNKGGVPSLNNPMELIEKDPFTEFKNHFVNTVITGRKLNELPENEWVEYWENEYLKTEENEHTERQNNISR